MSIKVALHHRTHYKFDRPVALSPHIIRLRPAPHTRTPIESYAMNISPKEHFINWQQDPFGNYLARIVFLEKATELRIDVELIADLSVINPFDFFYEESARTYPFEYSKRQLEELQPYLEIVDDGPLLNELLKEISKEEQPTTDFLVHINQTVNQKLNYNLRMNPGVQSCEQTLDVRSGSCRDFAWLMVQLLRHRGIAARFVSGYSVQLKPDQKPLEGPAGVLEDVTDLHAWAEAYIPGAGWIGLDATSGLLTTEGHIPLACVPHFESAAPVEGATDPCEVEFDFFNRVKRLHEDPRVTKPYTDKQWEAILRLGEKVDEDLVAQDVRLTIGGEPTFVSIDDMEGDEWNTAADGALKRKLAWNLAERLRDKFGPGGFLQYAQGKWYPGEPLPRWAYHIYWRKDGGTIWKNPKWLANPTIPGSLTHIEALQFSNAFLNNLGLSPFYGHPAYEDLFYLLWEENRVPIDQDPLEADLDDPMERRTLAAQLDKGVGTPTGYVIPLDWNHGIQDWQSCRWRLRRRHLFLIPGNSPMGLRLPLDTLAKTADTLVARDPMEELPEINIRSAEEIANRVDQSAQLPAIKKAVCIEVRRGHIYIFIPPMDYIEHYLELLQVIERTASELQIPIVLEGYNPPYDYRMEKMSITPDPGVIEVNIHPANSWNELVQRTDELYEEARLARLGTEKFMLDGRHTGTGGGNHITLGAARPADSPFLRRPDLLRSMLTYWQHHPSLSYLFSSTFIGPTSQAPRVDEGRDDRLYEMEIAFDQVPGPDKQVPYWLVDRIFRNLLTDITGNTHRAEFCIDKLYSPDSVNGRLGILELRGFDMPPHKQMSLVQMLLIRALVSKFWKTPYVHNPVHWGTALHDKYLLPHFCYEDMKEITEDLTRAGYPFSFDWLEPFFEFRFPHYGTVQIREMELELRMAIEPWHVLGEEMSNTGTARFVDSSLERIQVKLTGLTNNRYLLLCNGIQVPLKPTGTQGEYVAGVRYRAWQPPSALHPTLGIDAPLVFDLVDTWNNQIVGGCTYHVAHPGGRSYDTFPVNALEAQSRRINRFYDTDFTPGPLEVNPLTNRETVFTEDTSNQWKYVEEIPKVENRAFPFTLDLRRTKKV